MPNLAPIQLFMLGRLAVPKIIYVRPVGSPESTTLTAPADFLSKNYLWHIFGSDFSRLSRSPGAKCPRRPFSDFFQTFSGFRETAVNGQWVPTKNTENPFFPAFLWNILLSSSVGHPCTSIHLPHLWLKVSHREVRHQQRVLQPYDIAITNIG